MAAYFTLLNVSSMKRMHDKLSSKKIALICYESTGETRYLNSEVRYLNNLKWQRDTRFMQSCSWYILIEIHNAPVYVTFASPYLNHLGMSGNSILGLSPAFREQTFSQVR